MKNEKRKIIHFSFFTFHFSLSVVSFFSIHYLQAVSVFIHSHHPAKNGFFCRAALFTLITKRPCVFYSNFITITCLRIKNSPVNSSHYWVTRQRIWVFSSWPFRISRPAIRATKLFRCKTTSAWNTLATRFWAPSWPNTSSKNTRTATKVFSPKCAPNW